MNAVLVASSDDARGAAIAEAIAEAGMPARPWAGERDGVVIVIDAVQAADLERLDALESLASVLVLARAAAPSEIAPLLRERRILHWEAVEPSAPLDGARLAERARSIARGRRQPLVASEEERLPVASIDDCTRSVAAAEAFARRAGSGAGVVARIAAVTDELSKNAVRAAPRAASIVELSTDRSRWCVRVRDPSGALTPDLAMDALARGSAGGALVETSPSRPGGGAGVGLYYVLGLADDLTITCAAGAFTEVAAFIETRRGAFRRGLDVFVQSTASSAWTQ